MKNQSYDLIGDIHGQHDKLVAISRALGYQCYQERILAEGKLRIPFRSPNQPHHTS